MQNLLLPPFGRVLLAYQQESIRLDFTIYIFVGKNARKEAVSCKKTGTLCSFLPYGESSKKYKWPIKEQKIIVLDTGFSRHIELKKICHHLLNVYQPRVIFLHSEDYPNEIFLPKGVEYNG